MACSPYQCDHDAWVRDANGGVRCVHRHKPELSNMYDLDWFLQPTLADGNCLPHTLAQCTQRLKKLFAVQQWGDLPSDFPSTHQEWRAFLVQEIQSHESTFQWVPGVLMHRSRAPLRQVTAWGLQQATKASQAVPRFPTLSQRCCAQFQRCCARFQRCCARFQHCCARFQRACAAILTRSRFPHMLPVRYVFKALSI